MARADINGGGTAGRDGRGQRVSTRPQTGQPNSAVSVVKSDGRLLWFGYTSGVIVSYNPRSGIWEIHELPVHYGAVTSFAFTDDFVLAGLANVDFDREKKDLVSGGGILILDRAAGRWGCVRADERIPSLSTNAFLLEGDTLWIGTAQGLVKWSLPGLLSVCEWAAGEPDAKAGPDGARR